MIKKSIHQYTNQNSKMIRVSEQHSPMEESSPFVRKNINPEFHTSECIDNRTNDRTFEYPTQRKLLPQFNLSRASSWTTKEDLNHFRFDVFNIGRNRNEQESQLSDEGDNHGDSNFMSRVLSEEILNDNSRMEHNYDKSENQLHNIGIPKISNFKKPEPFMGAFMQTQHQFSCFDVNISIPSFSEFQPFSRILQAGDFSRYQDKNTIKDEHNKSNILEKQQVLEDQKEEEDWIDNKNKGTQWQQDLENNQQNISDLWSVGLNLSKIDPQQQSPLDDNQINPNQTFFQNFDELLYASQKLDLHQSLLWDEKDPNVQESYVYELHYSKNQEFLCNVNKTLSYQKYQNKLKKYISESELCQLLIKMIQGVESELFTLDYHCLEWYFNHNSNILLENYLSHSLSKYLRDILQMANYKSKIQRALQYIKKQKYRRIFQQVGATASEVLLIIEEVCLETLNRKGSFLDFIITVTEFLPELNLIYDILINQRSIQSMKEQKTMMDFDYTFMNSQAIIFKQIVKISSANDNLTGRINQLTLKLLRSAFKPITFTLNRIVFQQTVEISNFDQTYLRYYFESMKDMLTFLGKRIQLIKQQSNQLYLICRIKEEIKILVDLKQLKEYDKKWKEVFANKKQMIKNIEKRQKKRLKQEKQKRYEEKVKEIYELKMKIYKINQQTRKEKKDRYIYGVKEIQRLKKQIAHREQTRRLNQLIEKEQQKGFLLDLQLKEKRNLIKQKQELLRQAQEKGLNNLIVQGVLGKAQNKQVNENQNELVKKQSQQYSQTLSMNTYENPLMSENSEVHEITYKLRQKQKEKQSQRRNSSMMKKQEEMMDEKPAIDIPIQLEKQQKVIMSSSESQAQGEEEIQSNRQVKKKSMNNKDSSSQEQDLLHVSTNTVLQTCIDSIIRQQIDITYLALSYLVYDRYQFPTIIEFMRKIFMTGNGQAVSDFLSIAVNNHNSNINLKHFNECVMFDSYIVGENRRGHGDIGIIGQLQPEFYEMGQYEQDLSNPNNFRNNLNIYNNKQVNMFHDSLELHIGFQFKKIPSLLEPYFSYIHLSKYMQIFSFILKIRHSSDLLSESLIQLNQIKRQILEDKIPDQVTLLNKLYKTRYIAQAFLNTLQNFLYYRVIEKEIKNFKKKLIKQELVFLNELSSSHLRMLDNIIKFGLIENPHRDISKRIKMLLSKIREFKNIVDMFCEDDVPEYIRGQVEGQVQKMFRVFGGEQRFLEMLFHHP